MDLYGPMRDVARKYLKSIPHTKGVPTQGEVDELTRVLAAVREQALLDATGATRSECACHGAVRDLLGR